MTGPRVEHPTASVEHPTTSVEHPTTSVEHPTTLWVERPGIRRYTGRSSRGAEVFIGSVTDEGVFTP
ncbi:MAG: OsmC family peroxiredoxin, partial [Mycobacterium sp.]|nr:OsmC family peroxiredoxin [Mycobacterium sp.]